ncbi:MAG: NERD domain-containing protein [Bacillaceae bacterium]|nr:NERD domain-containing protein [Bacillaceae bacterium]
MLDKRKKLEEKDKNYYLRLQKGFDGERSFDLWMETIQGNCLVLHDLLLKFKNNTFQIDSASIFHDTIYMFEVKNFEGDHYYDSERMYMLPDTEVNNPLIQVKRGESLFRQLLQSLGYSFTIKTYVVFINPDFTLYKTPLNIPFIFLSQMKRLINKLSAAGSWKLTEKHKRLADKLVSLHIKDSPYKKIPSYDYTQLRKGITCDRCDSFNLMVEGMSISCESCGNKERFTTAIVRSVNEFRLLFPEKKITTNIICDWCRVGDDKRRVRRVLQREFKKIGSTKGASYF